MESIVERSRIEEPKFGPAIPGKESSLTRQRILVVDDDKSLQPIFAKLIADVDLDLELVWADSAEEFLAAQAARPVSQWERFDLVIADIYMPGKATGFDVWNHFNSLFPRTPVVMMSGLSQLDFFKSVGDVAIVPPYLEKPLDFGECKSMIEGFLKKRTSN